MNKISKSNKQTNKNYVTQKELDNLLNFTFNYLDYADGISDVSQKFNTPYSANEHLKSINNPNQGLPTNAEDIESLLQNTNSKEEILRNLAIRFEIENIFYRRLIQFNSDLLAYNLTWDCYNFNGGYSNKEFNRDLDILKDFINRFDFKSYFSMCHRQMLRQGAIAVSVRDDYEEISLQELPLNYTKIVGRDPYGLLFAFNLEWFLGDNGADLNMYKPVFKTMVDKVLKQNGNNYQPYNPNSSYIYWDNCDRRSGFWYFKPNIEIATLIPYYSAMFPVLATQPIVRRLQHNKNIISASKMLVGNISMLKEQKAGNITNQTAFDSRSIGQMLGKIKQGIADEINVGIMPSDGLTAVDFSVQDKNIYGEQAKIIANQSVGSSASLLSNEKLNIFESRIALDIDSNFAKSFYEQFEAFMEYQINSRTKKYKFKIKFHDTNTHFDKEQRFDNFNALASSGIVRWDLLARCMDENVFELERSLKYNKHMNLDKYLIPLLSLHNQSKDSGRPSKDNAVNDNTAASQEAGSNEAKE